MKTVSIVIPCRNEASYISACLDSIVASSFPKEFLSVYVCDGMSDDGTTEIIKGYSEKFPYIHLIANEKRTTPYALNLGIKADNSDAVIILGAHSAVAEDFIEKNYAALFSDEKVGCAGGILINNFENRVSRIIGYAMSQPFGVGNAHFRTGAKSGYVDTVAFGCYKREVFEKIGYFDEQLTRNQDDEFNYRLKKAGYEILLDTSIRSYYVVRSSYKKLLRQYFQYGYWKVFVNQKHKMITTFRQLVPFFFVAFVVLGAVASFFSKYCVWFYIAVLMCYFLSALFFAAKSKLPAKDWLAIIFSFSILHISYGSGYWVGLWDFLVRGKKPVYDNSSR